MVAGSPEAASELVGIGEGYLRLKDYSKAEEYLREAYEIRKKDAVAAWTTYNATSLLGRALFGQATIAKTVNEKKSLMFEAKELLVDGYRGMKLNEANMTPREMIKIADTLDGLIELYTALNKPHEVAKYRQLRTKYPLPGASTGNNGN